MMDEDIFLLLRRLALRGGLLALLALACTGIRLHQTEVIFLGDLERDEPCEDVCQLKYREGVGPLTFDFESFEELASYEGFSACKV